MKLSDLTEALAAAGDELSGAHIQYERDAANYAAAKTRLKKAHEKMLSLTAEINAAVGTVPE